MAKNNAANIPKNNVALSNCLSAVEWINKLV